MYSPPPLKKIDYNSLFFMNVLIGPSPTNRNTTEIQIIPINRWEMFTNDPHTGSYMKNSYENLLLPIKAMTYSKEGDDIVGRQRGGPGWSCWDWYICKSALQGNINKYSRTLKKIK